MAACERENAKPNFRAAGRISVLDGRRRRLQRVIKLVERFRLILGCYTLVGLDLRDLRFTASYPHGPSTFVGEVLTTLAKRFLETYALTGIKNLY